MTNIGHFRAAAKPLGGSRDITVRLWVAPPTQMDESERIKEGHYANFGVAGASTEMPSCTVPTNRLVKSASTLIFGDC